MSKKSFAEERGLVSISVVKLNNMNSAVDDIIREESFIRSPFYSVYEEKEFLGEVLLIVNSFNFRDVLHQYISVLKKRLVKYEL